MHHTSSSYLRTTSSAEGRMHQPAASYAREHAYIHVYTKKVRVSIARHHLQHSMTSSFGMRAPGKP